MVNNLINIIYAICILNPFLYYLTAPDALNTSEESKNCQDDTFLRKYRNEIWDVIESPMYSVAMTEACDRCFKRHMEILRQDVFNIIPPVGKSCSSCNVITSSSDYTYVLLGLYFLYKIMIYYQNLSSV